MPEVTKEEPTGTAEQPSTSHTDTPITQYRISLAVDGQTRDGHE